MQNPSCGRELRSSSAYPASSFTAWWPVCETNPASRCSPPDTSRPQPIWPTATPVQRGQPGVAMVVPGVGIYNVASGLATAYARSSPVLLIAGQVPREAIGKDLGAVHEISNQGEVVRPVTKWQRMVKRPREVPAAVNEAFRKMRTGRPRPVLIEIPPEVAVEREEVELLEPAPISPIVPSPFLLRMAAGAIAKSKRPVIYAGGGVSRANAENALVGFSEATNIPVVKSNGGKGAMSDRHSFCYGPCFSPRGERQEMNQLFEVMKAADVVIGIGARFSLGNPAGNASTLININVDDNELTRVQTNTIPLHGDAKATLEAFLPILLEVSESGRPSPAADVAAARRLIRYDNISLMEPQYLFIETIQKSVPENSFIVWDITQLGYYARTHYQVNHPKTYIDSGYSFNLGYAFPTALGAKIAQPNRPVLCMVGDGGFMFNASELSTAVNYGINVVTVIHDVHVWTISSGYHVMTAHVLVDPEHAVEDLDGLMRSLREIAMKKYGIRHVTIQLEQNVKGCTELDHVDHLMALKRGPVRKLLPF